MASSAQDFFGLAVTSILGEGLNIPKDFWLPGTLSGHIGHFGAGSVISFGQASLAAGQGPYPFAFKSDGNSLFTGFNTTSGVHTVLGTSIVLGKLFTVAAAKTTITSTITGITAKTAWVTGKNTSITGLKVVVAGPKVTIGAANLTINGLSWNGYVVEKLAVAGKGFDIPHPTKPDTHRLRYICLEGPEVGTYLRGKLKGEDTIELPDYWVDKFIDPESITVNLTPIGSFQELFVKEIKGTKIIIGNNSGSQINCNYTVFAERVMNDKLKVEYKGQSPADYPGDNSQYSLAGWNYDRRR